MFLVSVVDDGENEVGKVELAHHDPEDNIKDGTLVLLKGDNQKRRKVVRGQQQLETPERWPKLEKNSSPSLLLLSGKKTFRAAKRRNQ